MMNIKEIEDILTIADSHLILLSSLEKQLNEAVDQIFEREQTTVKEIKNTFYDLREKLLNILNLREKNLLDETAKVNFVKKI